MIILGSLESAYSGLFSLGVGQIFLLSQIARAFDRQTNRQF